MAIRVVNRKPYQAQAGEVAVYIGRRNRRHHLPGSPLGNPYRVTHRKDPADVERAIQQYREHFYSQAEQPGPLREEVLRLLAIARQQDLALVCWCAPTPCHGEVIQDYLAQALASEAQCSR